MSTNKAPNKDADNTIINMITNFKAKCLKLNESPSPVKKRTIACTSPGDDEDTPSKRSKNDILDVSYISSPREIRRMRSDLLTARHSQLTLENQIKHMHSVRKEMEIMFENERASLTFRHEQDIKNIEELENQLQDIRKREEVLKSELAELKQKHATLKYNSEMKIDELEKDMLNASMKETDKIDEQNCEIKKLLTNITELEVQKQQALDDANYYKHLYTSIEKKLVPQKELQQELEMKEVKLQRCTKELKDLQYIKDTQEEIQQLAKSQQHKLMTFNEMEKENKKLKDDFKRLKGEVHNKLLLEEEVHDLRNRLVIFREQEKKLNTLQVTKTQYEMYLSEWRAVASTICETTAPDTTLQHMLRALVERLQRQEINLTSEKMDLEQKYKTVSHEHKLVKLEMEKNVKLAKELGTANEQRQNLIHRMQKKLQLVINERDSYRKQLDSYEKDLTICLAPSSSAQPGTNQLQTQKERIDNLEGIVDGYKELISKLESDLQRYEPVAHGGAPTIGTDQLNRLKSEIEQLKAENARLRERKDQLEIKLENHLIGEDVVKERVVHSVKNPLADHLAEVANEKEKLQQEVERLKRKVHKLEEGLEASRLNETTTTTIKDVQTLKEQLKSSENQIQRLKDFFKSSMQEFRNVSYMLLGYKIDRTSSANYRLTSMYADSADDNLLFQINSDGDMNLLENDYSSNLKEAIDLHLRQQGSIPVFLSNLTMDLFSNKTMASKVYQVDDDEDDDDDDDEEDSD